MFERHLTDEVLILLVGGQLATASRHPALDHIQHCQACRHRYAETRSIHAAWVELSDCGLTNILRARPETKRKSLRTQIRFPWVPVSAALASSLIVILVLSMPKAIPEASASELLGYAIQNEREPDTWQTLQLSVKGTICVASRNDGQLIPVQRSTLCTEATGLVQRTPWRRRALSPRTFQDWHDSLSDRHDTVTKQASSWTIDTDTRVGIVREASLALRLTDYRPFSLRLRFDNQQELTISEDTQPPGYTKSSGTKDSGPSKILADPTDVLEVHAWEVLQRLNADSGWEANVLRDGSRVIVKARVPNETRKREIVHAFESSPDVELDVRDYRESPGNNDFLAQRTLDGDAPALARDWLERQFPDTESRDRYANSTVELSKSLLGRAFVLEQIQKRQRKMKECSCRAELLTVIQHEVTLLTNEQRRLSFAAQLLVGFAKRPFSRPLTYDEAKRLDAALGSLLISASPQGPPSYDQNIEVVRHLL